MCGIARIIVCGYTIYPVDAVHNPEGARLCQIFNRTETPI